MLKIIEVKNWKQEKNKRFIIQESRSLKVDFHDELLNYFWSTDMKKILSLFIFLSLITVFHTVLAENISTIESTNDMVYTGEPQKLKTGARVGWLMVNGYCIKTDETPCGPVNSYYGLRDLGYTLTEDQIYKTETGTYELYRVMFNAKSSSVIVFKGINTIKPKDITVKAANKNKIYGDADPELTATVDGLIGTDTINFTIERTEGETSGSYTITPTGEVNQGNYNVNYETGTLTINPKPLTITAGSGRKEYDGTPLTNDSCTSSNLVPGDSIYSVKITGSQTYVGVSGNNINDAQIHSADGDNVTQSYAVTYIPGQLEVTKRDLSITAASASKIYDGTALTANTYSNTALAPGDIIESVSINGSQQEVGESANTASNAKIVRNGEEVTPNYNITYILGSLKVTNGPEVIIIADSGTKVYDGTALTVPSYKAYGLLENHHVKNVTVEGEQIFVGATENVPKGAKILDASGNDVSANYDRITYQKGTLTVIPKLLTITAADDAKVYDGVPLTNKFYSNSALIPDDKIISVNISGSQTDAGESANSINGALIINSDGTDVTSCYDITYKNGTLKVSQKNITITADKKEKIYGESDPVFTATADGLIGTDSISYTLSRTSGEDIGVYTITPSGEISQKNYSVTYSSEQFVILPRPLIIKSGDAKKEYDGMSLSSPTFTSEGLAVGDTITSVSITASITDVGISDNTISNNAIVKNMDGINVSQNYTISYQNGILEIMAYRP